MDEKERMEQAKRIIAKNLEGLAVKANIVTAIVSSITEPFEFFALLCTVIDAWSKANEIDDDYVNDMLIRIIIIRDEIKGMM